MLLASQKNLILAAAAILVLGFFSLNFFQNFSATGFSIFAEKTGEYFAVTISGENNYAFSFKNLKNETLSNVSANLTFSSGANISNYGSASLTSSNASKILSWAFETVAAEVNTSLTFTSDAAPTEAKVSATNAAGSPVSETTSITPATTTTQATTTTSANATTTTTAETTTTTIPTFDYDEDNKTEIYDSKFLKSRGDGKLPEGFYIKKNLDLENSDDTETYESYVEVDGNKAVKISGISVDDTRYYSEPIDWSGGNIKIKVLYKPIGNETCSAYAAFGLEVLFSDGTGDTTLLFTADNNGKVSGGSDQASDFYVSSKSKNNGWHQLSAKSAENFEAGRKLRFFASQPSENCGSGFYISEISIK